MHLRASIRNKRKINENNHCVTHTSDVDLEKEESPILFLDIEIMFWPHMAKLEMPSEWPVKIFDCIDRSLQNDGQQKLKHYMKIPSTLRAQKDSSILISIKTPWTRKWICQNFATVWADRERKRYLLKSQIRRVLSSELETSMWSSGEASCIY